VEEPDDSNVIDLMAALRASLNAKGKAGAAPAKSSGKTTAKGKSGAKGKGDASTQTRKPTRSRVKKAG
jgi:DNA end-binding protein Ku